jgi:hypothetical protein
MWHGASIGLSHSVLRRLPGAKFLDEFAARADMQGVVGQYDFYQTDCPNCRLRERIGETATEIVAWPSPDHDHVHLALRAPDGVGDAVEVLEPGRVRLDGGDVGANELRRFVERFPGAGA